MTGARSSFSFSASSRLSSFSTNTGAIFSPKVSTSWTTSLRPRINFGWPSTASRPALSQGSLGWRRPCASEPMLGAPPKPAIRSAVTVDLQRGSNEQVCRVEPSKLTVRPARGHRAIPPGEIDVGPGAHVGIHAHLRAEAVDLFDPSRLDRGNQCRMRVERPVRGDLALEPELFRVGRKQQLDGSCVETNAMVQ